MGTDKALLRVEGTPMALRVAQALRRAGANPVVAIGGDATALGALGLEVVADDEPSAGPLAATRTALAALPGDPVAVLACDLLRPDPAAITALVDALREAEDGTVGAVPFTDGHHQWGHALWRPEAAKGLSAAWAAGIRSLRRAADGLPVLAVRHISPDMVADADAPGDMLGTPGTRVASSAMEIPEVDVAQLSSLQAAGAPVIDVREDDEYAEVHVPGAQHIPLGQVPDRLDEVPREGTVYVVCARGGRSAKAVEHYRSQGIDAVNVAGGTLGWIDAGLPTEGGSGAGSA